MNKHLLEDAFAHHVWATLKLLDACKPLTDQQLDTAVPGTFGSILKTMRHLVQSDRGYLFRLSDGANARIDTSEMDIAEMAKATEATGAGWMNLLANPPESDRLIEGKGDEGVVYWPAAIWVGQAIHHGTDHRSQVCTALTSLGVEPPLIDVWDYGIEHGMLHLERPATT